MILLPSLAKTPSNHGDNRTKVKPIKTITKNKNAQKTTNLEATSRQTAIVHHHSHKNSGAESDMSDASSSSNNNNNVKTTRDNNSQIPNIHLPPINIDRASLIGSDTSDQQHNVMLDTNSDNTASVYLLATGDGSAKAPRFSVSK